MGYSLMHPVNLSICLVLDTAMRLASHSVSRLTASAYADQDSKPISVYSYIP